MPCIRTDTHGQTHRFRQHHTTPIRCRVGCRGVARSFIEPRKQGDRAASLPQAVRNLVNPGLDRVQLTSWLATSLARARPETTAAQEQENKRDSSSLWLACCTRRQGKGGAPGLSLCIASNTGERIAGSTQSARLGKSRISLPRSCAWLRQVRPHLLRLAPPSCERAPSVRYAPRQAMTTLIVCPDSRAAVDEP